MPTLSENRIADLLQPYLGDTKPTEYDLLISNLSLYLDHLIKWNARTNLTAIRDPGAIVQRHFGESLFAARILTQTLAPTASLLDFGSGAGFPGLPIQLYRPTLRVTLAESQGKKAAFLREAVRTLALPTEVWPGRVEAMPPSRRFDCITLRAVDRMDDALKAATARVAPGGTLAILGGDEPEPALAPWPSVSFELPLSDNRRLHLYTAPA